MANTNVNSQISRMKSLMKYGLQTESKQSYSSVEYQKVGADGKTYGIIREGNSYYIKTAPKKGQLVKEDFDYIGGFKNRKENQYSSYALAQKQFDLKMRSLQEAYSNGKNIIIESWNPDKQQELSVEATDNMRKEILRERQIMRNAQLIEAKKGGEVDTSVPADGVRGKNTDANSKSDTPKTTQGQKVKTVGKAPVGYNGKKLNCKNGDPFCVNVNLKEQAEVLGFSRDHDDYLDTSHGTKIGSSKPWHNRVTDSDAVADAEGGEHIAEGVAMHNTDNQNSPTPGTGEIGDDAPFDGEKGRQLDEANMPMPPADGEEEDPSAMGADGADGEMPMPPADGEEEDPSAMGADGEEEDPSAMGADGADGEMPEGDEEDFGANEDYDDSDYEDDADEEELYGDDIEDRLENVEEILAQIADKLGVGDDVDADDYEDDSEDLYDDDEEADDEYPEDDYDEEEEEPEYEIEMDSEDAPEDSDDDDEDEDKAPIYETRAYRRAVRRMNEENRLDYFGKHPAYQKKVMTLPPNDNFKKYEGQYDMNDSSVDGEQPYGQKIGSSAPFTISHEMIQNSIAESVNRMLKKK